MQLTIDLLCLDNNLVRCLVSSKQIKEAISTCFGVLSEIGVPMPIEATNEACFEAVVTTKTMLARFPKEDAFVGLPRMSNTNMLVAMEFLQSVLVDAFNSPDPRMGVLIALAVAGAVASCGGEVLSPLCMENLYRPLGRSSV